MVAKTNTLTDDLGNVIGSLTEAPVTPATWTPAVAQNFSNFNSWSEENVVVPRNSYRFNQKKINETAFIQISADDDYYNVEKQLEIKNTRYFTDVYEPSLIILQTNSKGQAINFRADGFFGRKGKRRSDNYSQKIRTYLSSSNSSNAYKTGIEITKFEHWLAGLGKISAGTPGHIIEPSCYGVAEISTQASLNSYETQDIKSVIKIGAFKEIDLFDPVKFISLQGSNKPIDQLVTFPIVTADYNQLENYIFNGIIEPFPIRPVISNFSINAPFEPQGVRGIFGGGNQTVYGASDQIVSTDYWKPSENKDYFLDEGETIMMSNGKVTASLGATIGYFNISKNEVPAFEDKVLPRGEEIDSSYPSSLRGVVSRMLRQGEVYVSNNQKSYTSGFVYDGAQKTGTDSIAFGGLAY